MIEILFHIFSFFEDVLPFISGNPSKIILKGSPAVCASMVFIFSQFFGGCQFDNSLFNLNFLKLISQNKNKMLF